MPDWAVFALAAAGALLLVVASMWLVSSRRRGARALRRALADPDPAVRRAAIETAGAHGLGQFVDALTERTKKETSPTVRWVLAETVAGKKWEPTDSARMVALRLWARRELDTVPPSSASPTFEPAPGGPSPSAFDAVDAAAEALLESRVGVALGERVIEARLERLSGHGTSGAPGG
jgi:hypothetical protein